MKIVKSVVAFVLTILLMSCAGLAHAGSFGLKYEEQRLGKTNTLRVFPDRPCKDARMLAAVKKAFAEMVKNGIEMPEPVEATTIIDDEFTTACAVISPYNGRVLFVNPAGEWMFFRGTIANFAEEPGV